MGEFDSKLVAGGKGKSFFRWLNDLYNHLFGSFFGYTDTVQLGGGSKTRRHRNKNMRKNISHRRR